MDTLKIATAVQREILHSLLKFVEDHMNVLQYFRENVLWAVETKGNILAQMYTTMFGGKRTLHTTVKTLSQP